MVQEVLKLRSPTEIMSRKRKLQRCLVLIEMFRNFKLPLQGGMIDGLCKGLLLVGNDEEQTCTEYIETISEHLPHQYGKR